MSYVLVNVYGHLGGICRLTIRDRSSLKKLSVKLLITKTMVMEIVRLVILTSIVPTKTEGRIKMGNLLLGTEGKL